MRTVEMDVRGETQAVEGMTDEDGERAVGGWELGDG